MSQENPFRTTATYLGNELLEYHQDTANRIDFHLHEPEALADFRKSKELDQRLRLTFVGCVH